jgi:hypothetical protein
MGNAPATNLYVFTYDTNATAYYLAGTTGWQTNFDGIPTATFLPFNYTTNGGVVNITGYFGTNGAVTIPGTLNGLPVTSIANDAFYQNTSLTSVIIPSGVTNIGSGAFFSCTSLTNVTIPNTVTSIGKAAFENCSSLTSLIIPASVTSIATVAFSGCTNLTSVVFQGNAPGAGLNIFYNDSSVAIYYSPGTTGWGSTFAGTPTIALNPPLPPQVLTNDGSFGVRTNQFGFNIYGTNNQVVVIEVTTNLASQIWTPIQTNTLAGNSAYFSDPQWTNYRGRFYRVR